MNPIVYSDVSNKPSKSEKVINEHAVYQALDNLLSTEKGERLFLPNFGAELRKLLFEPIDEMTAFLIKSKLIESIQIWEPRVELITLSVIPYPDDNLYVVNLIFKIKGLEGTYNWTKILKPE